jgi:hypothetical protein
MPRITSEEEKLFEKLEEEIPLQHLLEFREWAFVEIRLEAQRYFSSK